MKNFLTDTREIKFNEVVFANRNKQYGAYVLRTEESSTLKKALIIGVAFFAAVSVIPLIANSHTDIAVPEPAPTEGHIFRNIADPPKIEREIVKPSPPAPAPMEKTVVSTLPTPTKNLTKPEVPAPSKDELKDASIGTANADGAKPDDTYKPIEKPVTSVVPGKQADMPKTSDEPAVIVDVQANFSGGIEAFRNKVMQNFDTSDFEENGGVIKTTVTFIVEKDGTISGIKTNGANAEFSLEAERTIKAVKGKWIPAKIKGQPVRSYFKFPISMRFE
ncbi:energy transducer TonB [Chryseobacterium sp.]|uniref:energy transducer TonB n=1 Tax=Chryseobacterium sp. TaxID=1871047 RepID=UPI0011CAAB34|nr:energy transducer TonB [Chryseobacterium sp.]TXF75003.1 energy transducer TonB [Chryseobacterium sp.]